MAKKIKDFEEAIASGEREEDISDRYSEEEKSRLLEPVFPMEFDYPKTYFHWEVRKHTILASALAVAVALMVAYSAINPVTIAAVVASAAALVYSAVQWISPLMSTHMLTRKSLILHFGYVFRRPLPVSTIVRITERRKIEEKPGIYSKGSVLYAVTRKNSRGIEIQLRRPIRFRKSRVDTVITNLHEPEELIKYFNHLKRDADEV